MKVLYLHGTHVNAKNWFHDSRPLLRIYENTKHQPKVEAVDQEQQVLAAEVQQLIDERLSRPDGAFAYHVGTKRHHHARKLSKPGDSDLLEAIRGDIALWGIPPGTAVLGGYNIIQTRSKIVEE